MRGRPWARAGALIVALLGVVSVGADLIASDRPIAARVEGTWFLLPTLLDPPALRGQTLDDLRKDTASRPGDWLIEPLVPFGPNQIDLPGALTPPSSQHLLGTDDLGRDVLSRMVHGARVTLAVSLGAVALYVLLGVLLGLTSGYFGGRLDAVLSRLTEVMLSFPIWFLILCVLGLLRPRSLLPVAVVIGLTRWPEVARLVRAEALRLRELDFIAASRALGASDARVLFRHILPNAMGPVWVSASFGIAAVILLESGLSFLGVGAPPPASSWGELLTQAHRYVVIPGAWWLTVFPGLALFLTVTAFNLVGEGLRDKWDPR